MNEEKTIHKFLNKEKDKKIYEWRKPTVRKHPRLNYVQLIHEQYFHAPFIIPVLLQHFLLNLNLMFQSRPSCNITLDRFSLSLREDLSLFSLSLSVSLSLSLSREREREREIIIIYM